MDAGRDLWVFTTEDGVINSLIVRPWNNLEDYLENTLEEIYKIHPDFREKGGWFFIGDLLR